MSSAIGSGAAQTTMQLRSSARLKVVSELSLLSRLES